MQRVSGVSESVAMRENFSFAEVLWMMLMICSASYRLYLRVEEKWRCYDLLIQGALKV